MNGLKPCDSRTEINSHHLSAAGNLPIYVCLCCFYFEFCFTFICTCIIYGIKDKGNAHKTFTTNYITHKKQQIKKKSSLNCVGSKLKRNVARGGFNFSKIL